MSASPSRRDFLRSATGGALGLPALLSACSSDSSPTAPGDDLPGGPDTRFRLRLADEISPVGSTLVGAPGTADIGGGLQAPVWALNGQVPSPLLRVRRGGRIQLTMQNQLPQDLILHWHGLVPPDDMDGHPRWAVGPGGSYAYDFAVSDRAGTYWYHSHTHHRTAEQTYRGIAGLLLVEADEEQALGLPSGAREIPLILQDRRVDAQGVPYYDPIGPAMMAGYMGPEGFANGTRRAFLEVDAAVYRFRILNGSNARIFRLAFDGNLPFVLIGNDGGLLPAPVTLTSIDMAPAERADLLLDLRSVPVGQRIGLRSIAFTMLGGMGFMGGQNLQGDPLDLLELRVARAAQDDTRIPTALPMVPGFPVGNPVRERTFVFTSEQMSHRINGREWDMDRIDERIPFDEPEVWTFVNDSAMPHPVHVHATHFEVLSRTGGRGRLLAWEAGRKDTVLLHPRETVRVALRFTAQRGLYLMHCHNLEHEDHGMMANILIE
jgi:FtsP/CotA-like multicopper oxidase with cupredoxin domain